MPPETKKGQRIKKTIEFWENSPPTKFAVSEKSISFFKKQIAELADHNSLSAKHLHAAVIAVSLIEAQIRDCVRVRIDDVRLSIDFDHKFFKNKVNPDATLLENLRGYKLSLGEFVVANINISSVEDVWSAIDFCFGDDKRQLSCFSKWCAECQVGRDIQVNSIKTSLSAIYQERNKFVHELNDHMVGHLGFAKASSLNSALHGAALFVEWVQWVKIGEFSDKAPELETPRGQVGKQINETINRIENKLKRIHEFLNTAKPKTKRDLDNLEELRRALRKTYLLHRDLLECYAEFIYYAVGPGTLAADTAWGRRLIDLESYEHLLNRAIEHKKIPE